MIRERIIGHKEFGFSDVLLVAPSTAGASAISASLHGVVDGTGNGTHSLTEWSAASFIGDFMQSYAHMHPLYSGHAVPRRNDAHLLVELEHALQRLPLHRFRPPLHPHRYLSALLAHFQTLEVRVPFLCLERLSVLCARDSLTVRPPCCRLQVCTHHSTQHTQQV